MMRRFTENPPPPGPRPRYTWPWYVLAAVVLGILLAIIWVGFEVRRTRRLRQWSQPVPETTTNQSH